MTICLKAAFASNTASMTCHPLSYAAVPKNMSSPAMQELCEQCGDAPVFSVIDLSSGLVSTVCKTSKLVSGSSLESTDTQLNDCFQMIVPYHSGLSAKHCLM